MTTIIIGGGASGLACAIRLKQNNPKTRAVILERLSLPGRKILATGNGRCNLTNVNAVHFNEVSNFFKSIGLAMREEEGRIYPYSLKAETVLGVLTDACEALGVKIITDCTVNRIDKSLNVYSSKGIFKADSVIVAAGGAAQKNLGSNGSGYGLLKTLGHSVTPLSPALVQLTSSSRYPKAVKGTRTRCRIEIELDGKAVKSETGEVLFTDYGLSGIAAMNLSETVGKNFNEKNPKRCTAVLDLVPEMSENELVRHIQKFGNLKGIIGTTLSSIIAKQAQGDPKMQAKCVKGWRLIITGTKGYDYAQITSGGIPLDEVCDFESKIIKNLYICGEILDLQYGCGGYNLDSAWYSGIRAADKITGKNNDKN